MSQQERVSWVSLIVNVVVATWYFSFVFGLPAGADVLSGVAMTVFVAKIVGVAMLLAIAAEILLRVVQRRSRADGSDDATLLDERDALISLKATRNAHAVLIGGVVLLLVQIVLIEWVHGLRSLEGTLAARPVPQTVLDQILTGPIAAAHVAQLLLLILTLAAITLYASRIFFYRRGY